MPHWLVLVAVAIASWTALSVVVGLFLGRILSAYPASRQRSSRPIGRRRPLRSPAPVVRLSERRRDVA